MPPKVDYFCSETIRDDLKGKTVRGGMYTGVAQGLTTVVGLIAIPILGRLLEPTDFGLIAMVAFFTNFAAMFVDAGLSMATVQRDEITQRQVSNLFWLAVGVGSLLAALVSLCSPLIAWFYSEPRLIPITCALTASYVFTGLTIQHEALLRRAMQFHSLSVVVVLSQICGQSAGVLWAWFHYGRPDAYWALVLIPVTVAFVRMLTVLWYSRWVPSLPSRRSNVLPMLKFGANLSATQFINYFARNADKMLIGWWWGAAAAGYYERAYKILLWPLQRILAPISAVAIPALSRLRDEPEKYRSYFRKGVFLSSSLLLPIVMYSIVMADVVVLAVLGEGWDEAASIFLALSPAALMATTAPASHWVWISMGRVGDLLKATVGITLVCLLAYVVALPWGAVAVAAGFSVATCIVRIPYVLYTFRGTPLTLVDQFYPMTRPASAAALAGVCAWIGRSLPVFPAGAATGAVVGAAIFSAVYLLVWIAIPGGSSEVRKIWRLVAPTVDRSSQPGSANSPT